IAYMVRQAEWTQAGADLRTVLGAGTLSEASVGDLDEALSLAEVPPPSEAGARGRARVRHDLSGRDLGPRLARWRAAVRRYQTSPVLGAPATPWSGERLFRRHRGGDPSGWGAVAAGARRDARHVTAAEVVARHLCALVMVYGDSWPSACGDARRARGDRRRALSAPGGEAAGVAHRPRVATARGSVHGSRPAVPASGGRLRRRQHRSGASR